MLVGTTAQKFDIAKMMRLLGGPVLLGRETAADFVEFANAIAASLEPEDAAAHTLVYLYIVEFWCHMRLVRMQGHLARHHGLRATNVQETSASAKISKKEALALLGMNGALDDYKILDELITASNNRLARLMAQIAMHRVALAQKMSLAFDRRQREQEIELNRITLIKDREIERSAAEREAKRAKAVEKPEQSPSSGREAP